MEINHRLLRPAGRLVFMVYNGFSYRQWRSEFWGTIGRLLTLRAKSSAPEIPAVYDRSNGEASPHTGFVSSSHLRSMCRAFRDYKAELENITSEPPFRGSRGRLLRSFWPKVIGLDIYATAIR